MICYSIDFVENLWYFYQIKLIRHKFHFNKQKPMFTTNSIIFNDHFSFCLNFNYSRPMPKIFTCEQTDTTLANLITWYLWFKNMFDERVFFLATLKHIAHITFCICTNIHLCLYVIFKAIIHLVLIYIYIYACIHIIYTIERKY